MLALLRATVIATVFISPAYAIEWGALLGPPSADEIWIVETCAKTFPNEPEKANQCEFIAFRSILHWDADTAAHRVLNDIREQPKE